MLFTNHSQVLDSLNATRAIGTFERRFHALAKIELLFLDDYGLKSMKPPQDEDFHDLIAERYEQQATVVTSSLDFSE